MQEYKLWDVFHRYTYPEPDLKIVETRIIRTQEELDRINNGEDPGDVLEEYKE